MDYTLCAWTYVDETYYFLLVERRTKQVLFFACQIFMRVFIGQSMMSRLSMIVCVYVFWYLL